MAWDGQEAYPLHVQDNLVASTFEATVTSSAATWKVSTVCNLQLQVSLTGAQTEELLMNFGYEIVNSFSQTFALPYPVLTPWQLKNFAHNFFFSKWTQGQIPLLEIVSQFAGSAGADTELITVTSAASVTEQEIQSSAVASGIPAVLTTSQSTMNLTQPVTNVTHPTTIVAQPATNVTQPTRNMNHLTADIEAPVHAATGTVNSTGDGMHEGNNQTMMLNEPRANIIQLTVKDIPLPVDTIGEEKQVSTVSNGTQQKPEAVSTNQPALESAVPTKSQSKEAPALTTFNPFAHADNASVNNDDVCMNKGANVPKRSVEVAEDSQLKQTSKVTTLNSSHSEQISSVSTNSRDHVGVCGNEKMSSMATSSRNQSSKKKKIVIKSDQKVNPLIHAGTSAVNDIGSMHKEVKTQQDKDVLGVIKDKSSETKSDKDLLEAKRKKVTNTATNQDVGSMTEKPVMVSVGTMKSAVCKKTIGTVFPHRYTMSTNTCKIITKNQNTLTNICDLKTVGVNTATKEDKSTSPASSGMGNAMKNVRLNAPDKRNKRISTSTQGVSPAVTDVGTNTVMRKDTGTFSLTESAGVKIAKEDTAVEQDKTFPESQGVNAENADAKLANPRMYVATGTVHSTSAYMRTEIKETTADSTSMSLVEHSTKTNAESMDNEEMMHGASTKCSWTLALGKNTCFAQGSELQVLPALHSEPLKSSLNPLIHADTGTVNSTGVCMCKGVKRKFDSVDDSTGESDLHVSGVENAEESCIGITEKQTGESDRNVRKIKNIGSAGKETRESDKKVVTISNIGVTEREAGESDKKVVKITINVKLGKRHSGSDPALS